MSKGRTPEHNGGRFRAGAARGALLKRIPQRNELKPVAEAVADFFRERFEYEESEGFASSHFEVKRARAQQVSNTIPPIPDLEYARLQLKLGTNRVLPALAHELLHLQRTVAGQPSGDLVADVPRHVEPFFLSKLHPLYPLFHNLIDHEITFGRFCDLGFRPSTFLGPPSPPYDYDAIPNGKRSPNVPDEIGFAWWSLEYLRHWITSRHGGGVVALKDADTALAAALLQFPEMDDLAAFIRAWVEKGAFKIPTSYPAAVTELFRAIRLPPYSRWLVVTRTVDGLRTTSC